jgi:hypothetical protein
MVVRSVVVVLVMVMVVLLTVVEAVLRGCKIFHVSVLYTFFNLSTYKFFSSRSNGPLIIAFKLKAKSTPAELFWV